MPMQVLPKDVIAVSWREAPVLSIATIGGALHISFRDPEDEPVLLRLGDGKGDIVSPRTDRTHLFRACQESLIIEVCSEPQSLANFDELPWESLVISPAGPAILAGDPRARRLCFPSLVTGKDCGGDKDYLVVQEWRLLRLGPLGEPELIFEKSDRCAE